MPSESRQEIGMREPEAGGSPARDSLSGSDNWRVCDLSTGARGIFATTATTVGTVLQIKS